MKLNKYLFNTVNNKEHGCGQRSVVWLNCGQPCSHQLHVLSTVFSWRPFSSFSLWIILLPSDSCCFLLFVQTVFLSSLSLPTLGFLCNRCFFVIWGDNLGGTFVFVFGHGFLLGCFRLLFHGLKVRQQLCCGVFLETDQLWFCIHVPSSQAAHQLSDQAVHELSSLAVHELSGSSGSRA